MFLKIALSLLMIFTAGLMCKTETTPVAETQEISTIETHKPLLTLDQATALLNAAEQRDETVNNVVPSEKTSQKEEKSAELYCAKVAQEENA